MFRLALSILIQIPHASHLTSSALPSLESSLKMAVLSATTTSRRSLPFAQSCVSVEACRSSPLSDYNIQKESTFTQSCVSAEACRYSSPIAHLPLNTYPAPIAHLPSQHIPSPHRASALSTHTQPPSRIRPPNAYLPPAHICPLAHTQPQPPAQICPIAHPPPKRIPSPAQICPPHIPPNAYPLLPPRSSPQHLFCSIRRSLPTADFIGAGP
ncbi:hypothetical protein DEU56DRAFT_956444 [Suillus clintonianus]|uniref:uncharacterized protein n=1 Tax=Suillus clintonianus TaxID=1904413 RepID=UPI001B85BFD2|nr:uncharacterized protein DEU56DRAFT_956444 [Suillus clintonianus]KAG2129597.1 hypothetical protein DEU56DRAFT_956444 [Suillus clintonianus]